MRNFMILLREDDTQSQRLGGMRQYRRFTLYVNGVDVESFRDDEANHGYNSGEYLDRYIADFLKPWEKALCCKCLRGEVKGRVRLIDERRRA